MNLQPARKATWTLWVAAAGFILPPPSVRADSLTNVQTVFIILMENVTWSAIKGSTSAPYINSTLLPQSSCADNFFTAPNTSGSLPQYLWLEAGTNFGINDSSDPTAHHLNTTNHFVLELERAGISWRAYAENISGTDCPTTSSGLYAAFHNPYVYFDDVYANASRCSNYLRPYIELSRDLTNNTVAHYNFIVPNLCHDMHNSSGCATPDRVRNGDDWLASAVPMILGSVAFRDRGALFITWDEGTSGAAGPFATIVTSAWAKGGGYRNTNRFDHASTLRTMQEIFGVQPLYAAAAAPSLSDLFRPVIRLSSPLLAGAGFQFTVSGLATNKPLYLQRSEDLRSWSNLQTNLPATNAMQFIDPANTNPAARFYRVWQGY